MNQTSSKTVVSGLILFALMAGLLTGCGSNESVSQVGSGGFSSNLSSAAGSSDLDLDLDGVIEGDREDVPVLAAAGPRPPVMANFLLSFMGTSNANMQLFQLTPQTKAQATLQPLNTPPTMFRGAIQNEPAGGSGITRLLTLNFGVGNSVPLKAPLSLSANIADGGPRAEFSYGEYNRQSPSVFLLNSTSGQIRLVDLSSSGNGSGSATVSFEQVLMVPKTLGSNKAVGSFLVNGQASFTF